MKMYTKPELVVEQFAADQSVAAGCTSFSYTETTTPSSQVTVNCVIGGQEEKVFTSDISCASSSTKHGIIDDAETYNNGSAIVTDDGVSLSGDYFVWYTRSGDTGSGKPSSTLTDILDALVKALGWTVGPGYHYASVNASSNNTIYTFSY